MLSILWICLELLFFYTLSRAFFETKCSRRQTFIALSMASIAMFFVVSFLSNILLKQLITFLCYITLSFYLFRSFWVWNILVCLICFIFAGIVDTAVLYGVCALLQTSLAEFAWRKLSYVTVVTVGKLVAILIAWLIFRLRKRSESHSPKTRWLVLMLIFPAVSLVMLFVVFSSYQGRNDLSVGAFLFSVGLAVANVAILYLIQRIEAQTKEEQVLRLLTQQMFIQTEGILALEKSYRAQRQATHDFNHHLNTLLQLLSSGDAQAATTYLQQLQKTQSERILSMNSRHPIIDAVMHQKCQVAKDADIDIQVHVNDLSAVTLPTDQIVVMLSNLMDNAIEACLRFEGERIIQCQIVANNSLFLSIRNTSLPVIISDNRMETCKKPKQDHGYGLPTVCRIIEQLQGEFDLDYEDGWFQFTAEIPNVTE